MPPNIDGLGDYAHELQQHWPDSRHWNVLALRLPEGAQQAWPEVTVRGFGKTDNDLTTKLNEFGAKTTVLHYVSHGYSPKGMATWLPGPLEAWKQQSGGKLIVFFHELFAFSPPWRKPFWRWPRSFQTFRRLCRLADAAMTSNPLYQKQLGVYGGMHDVGVAPVGPNIATLKTAPTFGPDGPLRVAVFGRSVTRKKSLELHAGFLRALNDAGRLDSIVLIGETGKGADQPLAKEFGRTELVPDATPEEVSLALATCHIGLSSTEEARIAKSGVYSAICNHGIVPVVATSKEGAFLSADPGQPGRAVSLLKDEAKIGEIRQRVAAHAELTSWTNIVSVWQDALRKVA